MDKTEDRICCEACGLEPRLVCFIVKLKVGITVKGDECGFSFICCDECYTNHEILKAVKLKAAEERILETMKDGTIVVLNAETVKMLGDRVNNINSEMVNNINKIGK